MAAYQTTEIDFLVEESMTLLSKLEDQDFSDDDEVEVEIPSNNRRHSNTIVSLENDRDMEQPTRLQTEKTIQTATELNQHQEIRIKEENITETMSSVQVKQEMEVNDASPMQKSLKSARREEDSSEEEDHDRYVNKTRQRLSFHTRFESIGNREIKSPISEPITPLFRNSPNYTHTPPHLSSSTPTEYRSFSSSSDSEVRHVQRDTLPDTNSLERNVSSLNIAQENIQNPNRATLPTPTRHTNSNSISIPPTPSQNSARIVDRFVPPAAVLRNGKEHHRNGSNGSNGLNRLPGPSLLDQEPREKDQIIINNNEYKILQKLGEGSSGKVFLVFSNTHNDLFALKWIKISRKEDKQSILNEISLMKSLKDDTVITLLDHAVSKSAISIIMEYGEIDLALLIRRQHKSVFDVNFVRYYWNQMLLAVYMIHKVDIVHSDLKPANFVVVKGKLKLIDFGIAKTISDDTTHIQRDVQIGTINYMAPEALTDRNEGIGGPSLMKQGRPSDVWSLGCILYQMIYGATPFYHLSVAQKIINIPNPKFDISFPSETSFGEPPQKFSVPHIIIALLKSCLHRDPLMRPAVSELLRHPFVYMTQ